MLKESRNSYLSGLKNQDLEFLQILDTYRPALKKIQISILLNHPILNFSRIFLIFLGPQLTLCEMCQSKQITTTYQENRWHTEEA